MTQKGIFALFSPKIRTWTTMPLKGHIIATFRGLLTDKSQINYIYATEADILDMALFGITAAMWREANPDKKGNIRDYADISQLVCLANLENLNALFINEGLSQGVRLND